MLATLAASVGKGLLAGLIGTAAMTLSSTIESKIRGRKPSDAPAKAAGKVLGVSPVGEEEKKRFSNIVHWSYGTSWGGVRGLIGATGLRGIPAGVAFFGMIWATALTMQPALGATPPPTEWGGEELAIDAWHHSVYVVTSSLIYEWLDKQPI